MKRVLFLIGCFAFFATASAIAQGTSLNTTEVVSINSNGLAFHNELDAGYLSSWPAAFRSYVRWSAASIRAAIPPHTIIQNVLLQYVDPGYQVYYGPAFSTVINFRILPSVSGGSDWNADYNAIGSGSVGTSITYTVQYISGQYRMTAPASVNTSFSAMTSALQSIVNGTSNNDLIVGIQNQDEQNSGNFFSSAGGAYHTIDISVSWNNVTVSLSAPTYIEPGSGAYYTISNVILPNGSVNSQPDQPYSGNFPQGGDLTMTGRPQGSAWVLTHWADGSNANPRIINPTSAYSDQGAFKGVHVTSASGALSNTSQRKAVVTEDNYIFLVYESSNHIWLERSTDDGGSWTLLNNAQQIDNLQYQAKQPSISYLPSYNNHLPGQGIGDNELYITYQQQTSSGYDIKVARFNESGQLLTTPQATIYSSTSSYTNNATPVISVNWYNRDVWLKQMVGIWKEPTALYWWAASYNGSTFQWNSNPAVVSASNSTSLNPAIDVYKYDFSARQYGPMNFPIAFDQNGQSVKYGEIVRGYSGAIGANPTIPTNAFAGSYRPSIVAVDNTHFRLCWNAYLDDPADTPPQSIVDKLENPSVFWGMGSNVTSTDINDIFATDGTYDNFAVGWTQNSGSGYSNYAAKGTALSSPINLSSSGKDMQLYNAEYFSSMYGIPLSTSSSPYTFLLSNMVGNGLDKASVAPISSGRMGVVSLGDSNGIGPSFYFAVGDLTVDGRSVSFSPLDDSTDASTVAKLSQCLFSQPFTVTNESSIVYDIEYGVVDSVLAASSLGTKGFVRFEVELIDAKTEKVIGTYDDVTFSGDHMVRLGCAGSEVSTNGIGNCAVKLHLSVISSLQPQCAVGELVAPGAPNLFKSSDTRQQYGYQGLMAIKDYELSQNFPNPFNPATVIHYAIPNDGMVTLKIYDALGREVKTLVHENQTVGIYTVTFDASKLSSGIYFYRLVCGGFVSTKKMLLIK